MKKCLNCEKPFEPLRPTKKYCSENCRVYFNRKTKGRKSQAKQPPPPPIDPKKTEIEALNKQIAAIEAEPQPAWVKSLDGFQSWKKTQQKRLEVINQKLFHLL